MDIRQRLEAFWSGERPDQIPLTIYEYGRRHIADDPAWQPMFENGLGVTHHVPSFHSQSDGVEYDVDSYKEDGKTIQRRTIRTPVGEIFEVHADGWRQKFYLETAEDYAVMTYVTRHAEVVPAYSEFLETEERIAPYGIALASTGRTPMQTILVDMVGLENFSFHLYDLEAEMMALYEALLDRYRQVIEIVAGGPGRFVSVLENFTSETLGPKRYAQFLLPVYEELFPILHAEDKIIGTHYDGKIASCQDLVARSPIDLIESLTPPPEGDMTLTECRAAWPDKLFWSNINVGCYDLPPDELCALVLRRVKQAAPDGTRLAFEVSEQLPENWKTSIPIVLDALRETRCSA
jgi:hypothetical protein